MQKIIDLISKLAHSGDEIIIIETSKYFNNVYVKCIIIDNEAILEHIYKGQKAKNIDYTFRSIAKPGLYFIRYNNKKCTDFKFYEDYNIELDITELSFLMTYLEYNILPKKETDKETLKVSIEKEKIKDSLVYACYKNDMDKIKERIKNAKRRDLNKIYDYRSPLMFCAENDNLEAFKMLTEAGANVKHSYSGYNVLVCAINHSKDITMYIYKEFPEYFEKKILKTGFALARSCHNIETLNLIKNFGVSLEGNNIAYPNLHTFAESNNVLGVRFLIENGVNPLMLNKWDQTAYMRAELFKKKDVMEFLEKYNHQEENICKK